MQEDYVTTGCAMGFLTFVLCLVFNLLQSPRPSDYRDDIFAEIIAGFMTIIVWPIVPGTLAWIFWVRCNPQKSLRLAKKVWLGMTIASIILSSLLWVWYHSSY